MHRRTAQHQAVRPLALTALRQCVMHGSGWVRLSITFSLLGIHLIADIQGHTTLNMTHAGLLLASAALLLASACSAALLLASACSAALSQPVEGTKFAQLDGPPDTAGVWTGTVESGPILSRELQVCAVCRTPRRRHRCVG